LVPVVFSFGCGGPHTTEAKNSTPDAPATGAGFTVSVVPAENRSVEASVQVTGSFVAKETSDVAPETGGRVIQTPVDVGDFVKRGQVIARLEDRDAKLRLDQATAAEQQSEASLRQAQSRIGLGQNQQFNPDAVPEVLSAKANADSAVAQAGGYSAGASRRRAPDLRSHTQQRPPKLSRYAFRAGHAQRFQSRQRDVAQSY
jgi:multidrug efflux pump subunit AcrA (membrane-fusion protein)